MSFKEWKFSSTVIEPVELVGEVFDLKAVAIFFDEFGKAKVSREGVLVPEGLFREMMGAYVKMEQVLATLETLADKEALKAIGESREEVARGEYVEYSIDNLKSFGSESV